MSVEIDFDTLKKCKNLKLWIYINNDIIERDTSIANMIEKKQIVMLNPILVNDRPIHLDSGENKISFVAYPENEKPLMYAKLVVKTIKEEKENKFYYVVQLTSNPVPFNRRNSFRCFIGADVVVRIGTNRTTYKAICRDISEHGFSLVLEQEEWCEIGKTAHFVYNEAIGEKSSPDYQMYHLNIYGTCVRKEILSNGKFLYGFKQFSANHLCRKYVFHKERTALNKLL